MAEMKTKYSFLIICVTFAGSNSLLEFDGKPKYIYNYNANAWLYLDAG